MFAIIFFDRRRWCPESEKFFRRNCQSCESDLIAITEDISVFIVIFALNRQLSAYIQASHWSSSIVLWELMWAVQLDGVKTNQIRFEWNEMNGKGQWLIIALKPSLTIVEWFKHVHIAEPRTLSGVQSIPSTRIQSFFGTQFLFGAHENDIQRHFFCFPFPTKTNHQLYNH